MEARTVIVGLQPKTAMLTLEFARQPTLSAISFKVGLERHQTVKTPGGRSGDAGLVAVAQPP